jgi:photosystem II stability/assembly factor-like uncharacterized protein
MKNLYRKILIISSIIFLLYSARSYSLQYWIQQPSPVTVDLWDVIFLDSLTGWIAGDSGLIMKTTNGGSNWIIQNTETDKMIRKLFVVNENLLWAITWEIFPPPGSYYGSIFMKSTNGGDTWDHEMYADSNVFINTIYFIDSLKGFIAGYPSVLRFTTDGGKEWADTHIDSSFVSGFPIFDIKFYNDEFGHACGGVIDIAGAVYSSYDGGRSWTSTTVGPEPINSLYIFDSLNAIGAGGDFEYGTSTITTFDAGKNWLYRELEVFGIAMAIDFRTRSEGWIAMGIAEMLLYTLDSARTWDTLSTPGRVPTYDLIFVDEKHGWCVGAEGTILKYNYNKVNVNDPVVNIPSSHRLYQNYPNPFNPVTKISYSIVESANAEIKIYDLTSREMKTIVNNFHSPGKYVIDFDGNDLASGVYIYRLIVSGKNNTFTESKKMILLK